MRATASELPRLGKFLIHAWRYGILSDHGCRPARRHFRGAGAPGGCNRGGSKTRANGDAVQARPLGIHLEGPFLSHKRRGVHPPEYLVEPTVEIFDRLWQAARGHVRMITIAPEIPGAMEVIAEAARRGVCVSIGHSDAEMPVAQQAVAKPARVMPPIPSTPCGRSTIASPGSSAKCSAMTASPPI